MKKSRTAGTPGNATDYLLKEIKMYKHARGRRTFDDHIIRKIDGDRVIARNVEKPRKLTRFVSEDTEEVPMRGK